VATVRRPVGSARRTPTRMVENRVRRMRAGACMTTKRSMISMCKLKALLLTGAAALLVLAAMTATASAYTATAVGGEAIASVSLGKVTFEAGSSIACNIGLSGRLVEGPVAIVPGQLVGVTNGMQISNCEGGAVRSVQVSSEEPWEIVIGSVPAGLPNEVEAAETIVKGVNFQLAAFGGFLNCRYEGDVPVSAQALHVRGGSENQYTVGLLTVLENSVGLVAGGFGCPAHGNIGGTFEVMPAEIVVTVS
jgi:hypothetical protein